MNGDHYALDFARIFPPEAQSYAQWSLTRLLRREFVCNFSRQLSSDAFSTFALRGSDSASHNENVREAIRWLEDTVVRPQLFVESLT